MIVCLYIGKTIYYGKYRKKFMIFIILCMFFGMVSVIFRCNNNSKAAANREKDKR